MKTRELKLETSARNFIMAPDSQKFHDMTLNIHSCHNNNVCNLQVSCHSLSLAICTSLSHAELL